MDGEMWTGTCPLISPGGFEKVSELERMKGLQVQPQRGGEGPPSGVGGFKQALSLPPSRKGQTHMHIHPEPESIFTPERRTEPEQKMTHAAEMCITLLRLQLQVISHWS